FATRAYRRPAKPDEVARLVKLFQFADSQQEPFEQSVKHALKAVLVSPHFLFRIERHANPNNQEAGHPVSQYELATRLSYFLWSTMPDEELTRLASANKLHTALDAQVKRMLADPRSKALAKNFSSQWLETRRLESVTPDRDTFP